MDRKETNIYQNFGHKFCLLSHTLDALECNKNPVLGNLRRKLTIYLHDHQDIIFANWRGSSSLTLETIIMRRPTCGILITANLSFSSVQIRKVTQHLIFLSFFWCLRKAAYDCCHVKSSADYRQRLDPPLRVEIFITSAHLIEESQDRHPA